jgi:hypothetical protein
MPIVPARANPDACRTKAKDEMHYLVARYEDGRVFRGAAISLDCSAGMFMMDVLSGPGETGPTEFQTRGLKALFGVADLAGDPRRIDARSFQGSRPLEAAVVRFHDGETIVGIIPDFDPNSEGFYLVPIDPGSNNIWCYVMSAAVEEVRHLPPGGADDSRLPAMRRTIARVLALAKMGSMPSL